MESQGTSGEHGRKQLNDRTHGEGGGTQPTPWPGLNPVDAHHTAGQECKLTRHSKKNGGPWKVP